MRRVASYKAAVEWIALNDDIEWLHIDPPMISVTAAMAADLWGRSDAEITKDLRRAVETLDRAKKARNEARGTTHD